MAEVRLASAWLQSSLFFPAAELLNRFGSSGRTRTCNPRLTESREAITRLRHRGIHGATIRYWRGFLRIVLFQVPSRRVTKLWVVSLRVPTKVPTVLGRRFLTSCPSGRSSRPLGAVTPGTMIREIEYQISYGRRVAWRFIRIILRSVN